VGLYEFIRKHWFKFHIIECGFSYTNMVMAHATYVRTRCGFINHKIKILVFIVTHIILIS